MKTCHRMDVYLYIVMYIEFMLGEEKGSEVDNFVWLGSVIDTSCKSSKEMRKRLV